MEAGDLYERIKSGEIQVKKKSPLLLRFWKRVNKDGPIHPTCGQCWVWLGYKTKVNGYGQIALGDRNILAHRFSWELHSGDIPEGLCVLHRCDNRQCVNPSHLFLGTVKDNTDDMIRKGRGNPARGECSGVTPLTTEIVKEIRRRYRRRSQTDGGAALGREFGVTQEAISNIILRKSWRHIP